VHRIWSLVAGVPVGILGALAAGARSWTALEIGAAVGGALLLLAVHLAGRFASAEAERGAHLARAASVGLAALPAAAAAWLGLQPHPAASLTVVVVALAIRLGFAMRASGPGGGWLRQLAAGAGALGAGAVLTLAAAALLALLGGPPRATPDALASYVYGVDASVPLGPDPGCSPTVAAQQVIGSGASPAVGDGGRVVWFEGAGPDGRRQIHRLDRESGAARCWTCAEPGNNRRPKLSANGASIVFETDRYRGPFEPVNVELHAFPARADAPRGSRRLTFDLGPDGFGSLDPGGRALVWSSGRGGRYAVAHAALRSGHGGILLDAPRALVPGGAAWVAPLAWSPDARTLVVLRGDPLGVQETFALDPATGHVTPLSQPRARVVAASFSADGTTLAVATTRPAAAAAALPEWLGFLVARLATLGGVEATRFRGTGVRIGPDAAALAEVPLGEVARFGHPTGIALEPDARAFVLGQRRATAEGAEERLLRIELSCP
jgi:hypothetical protein